MNGSAPRPLEKHITFTSADNIRTICSPLFKHCNTAYFNFVRKFPDGSELCLTSDPAWAKHFIEQKLFEKIQTDRGIVGNEQVISRVKVMSWAGFPDSEILHEQKRFSGINVGMTLAFINSKHTDFYHMGTHYTNFHMTNFYISNVDLMTRFCYYFNEKARDLIELSTKKENLLFFPQFHHELNKNQLKYQGDLDAFVKETSVRKFFIKTNRGDVCLSKKEIACIKQLFLGKTSPEIGEALFLSKRTVESHIENAKQKFSVRTKSELMAMFLQASFDFRSLVDP